MRLHLGGKTYRLCGVAVDETGSSRKVNIRRRIYRDYQTGLLLIKEKTFENKIIKWKSVDVFSYRMRHGITERTQIKKAL